MTTKNLIKFLNEHRVQESGDTHTHLAWGKTFNGSFNIEPDEYNEFITLYKKAIKGPDYKLTIIETQSQYSKILVDIDITSKDVSNVESRLYTNDTIKYIGKQYIKAIKEQLNVNNDDLEVLVFTKPKSTISKDGLKDGFHLIFPRIITNTRIRHIIRDTVVLKATNDDYFNGQSADKIIDKAVVISNGWMLYGSSKENLPAYTLSGVYNHKMDLQEIIYSRNELINLTSVFNLGEDQALEIKDSVPPSGPSNAPSPTPSTDNNNTKSSKITKEGQKFIYDNLDLSRWDNYDEFFERFRVI